MSGIVLVERSSALSHLLQRTMAAARLDTDTPLTSYPELLALLQKPAERARLRLLLLGVPQRIGPDFEAVLEKLLSPELQSLPVLLLTHERSEPLNDWLGRRRESSLLLWTNFSRIPALIRQYLPDERKARSPGGERLFSLRILFVDDSQSVRFAYRQMLSNHGFDVEVAANVAEGLQKALAGQFDLAIIDYYLPDGTGDELCRRLADDARTRHLPIAIITGSYRDTIIKRCLDAGAVECMFKNEVLELTLARIKALARAIENQKAVIADRQRLDGILASVGDGVYGVDVEGKISFINPTGLRLLGYLDPDELLGKRAHDMLHHSQGDGRAQSEEESALGHAYRSGEAIERTETVFWTRQGDAVPVECSVVPLTINGRRDGTVVVYRNIAERKSVDQMRWELMHDPLTGAANRRFLSQALAQEIGRRVERGGYSSMLLIDLDRFRTIEEQGGRALSDRLLAEVAQRLKERLREGDVLARLEDDHFALLQSGIQLDNLYSLAEAVREQVQHIRYPLYGKPQQLTATVGVSVISSDTPSAEYALEHARLACQNAKRRGGNQVQVYVAHADQRVARELDASWVARFKEALDEDRFLLQTQPIVPSHAAEAQPQIFELLIRLQNRDGEVIGPGVFVPLAERVGLMDKIDLWVLDRALRQLAELGDDSGIAFTINLSNITVQDNEALRLIEQQIKASGVDPGRLIFEVTETSEIASLHSARRFIQTLKAIGVRFALDDFGTGFSSISHLKHLPVDFVKLEGSLIADLEESARDKTMISSLVGMAHALDLQVIAEHVNSATSLGWLRDCGVDYVQGHFLGEPRPIEETVFKAPPAAKAKASAAKKLPVASSSGS
ncbi:MAG: EAL domain-containing protein [Xanthomonadales bacterium]|nr:EAL domain-containing protein [Xanthomonadales bacterium]